MLLTNEIIQKVCNHLGRNNDEFVQGVIHGVTLSMPAVLAAIQQCADECGSFDEFLDGMADYVADTILDKKDIAKSLEMPLILVEEEFI